MSNNPCVIEFGTSRQFRYSMSGVLCHSLLLLLSITSVKPTKYDLRTLALNDVPDYTIAEAMTFLAKPQENTLYESMAVNKKWNSFPSSHKQLQLLKQQTVLFYNSSSKDVIFLDRDGKWLKLVVNSASSYDQFFAPSILVKNDELANFFIGAYNFAMTFAPSLKVNWHVQHLRVTLGLWFCELSLYPDHSDGGDAKTDITTFDNNFLYTTENIVAYGSTGDFSLKLVINGEMECRYIKNSGLFNSWTECPELPLLHNSIKSSVDAILAYDKVGRCFILFDKTSRVGALLDIKTMVWEPLPEFDISGHKVHSVLVTPERKLQVMLQDESSLIKYELNLGDKRGTWESIAVDYESDLYPLGYANSWYLHELYNRQ